MNENRDPGERESTLQGPPRERQSEQYSLARILGIWALAAAPMGILGWIVSPLLAPNPGSDPLGFGVTRIVLLTLGLIWLFVLSMIIVRREEGDLRWATVKRRLRLNAPREPTTGEPRRRLWLWVVPFLVANVVVELVLNTPLENGWVSVLPFFREPTGYSFDAIFQSQEIVRRLEGAWWFFALFVVYAVFNTILGEEFLFRGVLLPRMEGVLGRWVANSVLFVFITFTSPGDIQLRSHRSLVHLSRLSLQEHVDVHYHPLCTECVLCLLGARGRIGVSVGVDLL